MLQSNENLKLSVIIPTYNRSELLNFTLHSLTLQDLPKKSFEVIVVDDGSTDNSKEIVIAFTKRLNIKYFYKKDEGYCPSSTRNIGIMNAIGKICLFIDSGLLLGEKCLSAHLSFHSETELANVAVLGYVYGLYHNSNEDQYLIDLINFQKPTESINQIKERNISPDVRENHFTKYNDAISDLPAPWTMFLAGNVSVSRYNLIDAGMFDENFDGRWGCEDNELGFRLHQNGIKIKLCRKAESLHYPHEMDFDDKIDQGYENCIYFNRKHNTAETKLFLQHYQKIAISESIDINEILLSNIEKENNPNFPDSLHLTST